MSSTPLRLVMASANPYKVAELERLLSGLLPDVEVLPRPASVPDVVEDADSLVGNARLKAQALMHVTGMAAVADDTGLFVDALDGRPGVRSARFAGERATDAENVALLLAELDRVGAHGTTARSASFRTVAMVVYPDGTEIIGEGMVEGTIADAPVGEHGFGYDPVFVPLHPTGSDGGASLTFAQMDAGAKNAISHRFRACTDLASRLHHHVSGA